MLRMNAAVFETIKHKLPLQLKKASLSAICFDNHVNF